jgi:nondiscriminating glutamyl-tRNA synthetase
VLGDAPEYARVFLEEADPAACECREVLLAPGSAELFELALTAFRTLPAEFVPSAEGKEVLRGLVEQAKTVGIKGKAIYQPLRVALSGRDQGPELFYLVAGLGRSTIIKRLESSLAYTRSPGTGK